MRKFIITEIDGKWTIEEIKMESVFPPTFKASARDMISRLMQLVDVGPVAPQTEPERVGVSEL